MTHVRIPVLMHSSKDMRNKEGKKEGHASTNRLPGEGGVQEERAGQGEGEGQGTWLHPWHGILPLSILHPFFNFLYSAHLGSWLLPYTQVLH